MKKLTYLTLILTSTIFLSVLAKADDMIITIKKAGSHTAKVEPLQNSKGKSVVVPISFAPGANWDSVKDSYAVSCGTVCGLMSKKDKISIGEDGTATFHSKRK